MIKLCFIWFLFLFIGICFSQEDVNNDLWSVVWSNAIDADEKIYEMQGALDIDQDGKGEFLVYSRDPRSKLTLYEWTGIDNDYAAIWSYNSPAITPERGVAVGDINLDGKDEIVLVITVSLGEMAMKIFSWDGVNDNGIPLEPNAEWDPLRDSSGLIDLESDMKIVNLDSDPEPEIILPSNENMVEIGLQIVSFTGGPSGDMNDFDSWKIEFIDTHQARSVAVGDLDNDGLMEIYTAEELKKTLTIIENTGNADEYQVLTTVTAPGFGFPYDPGNTNLLVANFDGGAGELYLIDRKGRFRVATMPSDLSTFTFQNFVLLHEFGYYVRGMVLGNIDQDSFPDIYLAGREEGCVYDVEYIEGIATEESSYHFYTLDLNPQHERAHEFMPAVIRTGDHPRGDLDQDGKKEIIVASSHNYVSFPSIYVIEHPFVPSSVEEAFDSEFRQYSLQQNYPNPFNPKTTIEYYLPKANEVSLEVYDLQGNRIATLVHGHQNSGFYRVTWHGCDDFGKLMPSGIYFYQLKNGEVNLLRKMILAR